jgi:hypothetical protein
MILFLMKKTFFDMWDHLLSIFILNMGFLLVLAGDMYLLSLINYAPVFIVALFLGVVVLCLYIGIMAMMTRDIADYQTPEIRNFWPYLRQTWKASTFFALIIVAQVLIFDMIIPWYVGQKNLFGLGVASVLFWVMVTWALASQYYFPLVTQMEDNDVRKSFKNFFILFFDNTLFSIALLVGVIVIATLSSFVVFLLPGVATMLLWHQAAVKLRLYKYDYLEQNPSANRKQIPWEELLYDDRERVGPRTLRGMIFPWKE